MDLQVMRNLEQFFRLFNRWPVNLDDTIECRWPPYGLMLETLTDRLLMTSSLLEPESVVLRSCLSRWHPRGFMGLPQRIFTIDSRLMISCLCPSDSEAHDWYQLCLLQQKFLNNVTKASE